MVNSTKKTLTAFLANDLDFFHFPFIPKRFPFDSNNLIGYSIAFVLEYIILGYEFFFMASTMSFAIGGYWFVISAIKEFQSFTPMINDRAKVEENANESYELKTLVAEFIDAHGIVKQLSLYLNLTIFMGKISILPMVNFFQSGA